MGLVGFARSRSLSVLASMSVLTGMLVATAQPAHAVDNGVSDLLGALGAPPAAGTSNLAAWTSGLGSIDKLGEQLPLVAASPGGLLGFPDLFSKAVSDEFGSASSFGDLQVDKAITIDGNRTGHLETTVSDLGDGKKLDLVVTVDKDVQGEDLKLSSAPPPRWSFPLPTASACR